MRLTSATILRAVSSDMSLVRETSRAEEEDFLAVAEVLEAEQVAHAPFGDHHAGDMGGLADVGGGAVVISP